MVSDSFCARASGILKPDVEYLHGDSEIYSVDLDSLEKLERNSAQRLFFQWIKKTTDKKIR